MTRAEVLRCPRRRPPRAPRRRCAPEAGRASDPANRSTEYSDRDLIALCRWIKSDTLLRTDAELLEEMMRELGFQRRGRKIVERLNLVIGATA